MARVSGKAGSVYQGANIAGIKSWTLDHHVEALEGMGFDSSAHSVKTAGTDKWSGTFEGFKDGAPLARGSSVALELRETQTATQKWSGNAIITDISAKTEVGALIGYSYKFEGDGALTDPSA